VNQPRARRLALIAVWIPVVIYALLVSRQFFHTAGSAVFLSTDDGVANISYALATEGRYGFLSSPILAGLSRHDGVFSYGPFYFYVGAALTWLFGYHLMLLRSIHLAVMLGIAVAGGWWFRRACAGAIGALAAIGLVMAFERSHWPMVRPDSFVSMFAVALVMFAGAGIRTGRMRYWFGAGLAASGGAFTHLVAWSLVPASAAILVVSYLADARHDDGRWRRPTAVWAPLLGLVSGGAIGAVAFYASFGFRIGDQIGFLRDYQRYTGSMSGLSDPAGSFSNLLLRHFEQAYWYLPYPLGYLVWTVLVAAVVAVISLIASRAPERRAGLAMLGPPVVIWVVYFTSLGVYNNFHGGYAILNQVMWLWTSAALVAVFVERLGRWRSWQRAVSAATWIVALVIGVGMLSVLAPRTNYRAIAAASLTPINEYLDRVLGAVPARARAWGSVDFGIEHPGRIQLVQFWDGIKVLEDVPLENRRGLAPDYLIWGSVENGINATATLAVNGRAQTTADDREGVAPWRLFAAFADTRYRLVSLTVGPPYGVTRVYAWTQGLPAIVQPRVHVYDPTHRHWNDAIGETVNVPTVEAPSAEIRAAGAPVLTAVGTVAGDLPAARYLLTILLAPGLTPETAAVFVAHGSRDLPGDLTQPSSPLDISPWMIDETVVHLIYSHAGGPFYVSQFGSGGPAIATVQAAAILPLADYAEQRRAVAPEQALPASQWTAAFPEIAVTPAPAGVAVVGNTTLYGYQAYGPRIPVQPGQRLRLRVPVTVTAGRGCLGVLDQTELRWLVAPDKLASEYEFTINDSRTVKPVLADCSGSPAAVSQLRATIGDGSYAVWSGQDELYVDQLMRAFSDAKRR
jgi:hypothetical protein